MPMIVWLAVLLAAGAISLGAAWAVDRWLKSGRTVAFIGRSGAGKTTLLYLLERGDIPKRGLEPTTEQRKAKVTLEEGLSVFIIDSGGDRLPQWSAAVKQARGVVYFFDAHLIAQGNDEAQSALEADADHIKTMFNTGGKTHRFTIVGTHSDLFSSKTDEQAVKRNHAVQRVRNACSAGAEDVIVGSLADKKSAVRLAAQIAKRQRAAR